MVQQVRALAAKLDDLSSTPETQMVEGENEVLQVVLCPHRCATVCCVPPLHNINK